MSTDGSQFRSAAFGFNRRDVIHYIENIHQGYAAKLKKAERALQEERAARQAVEQKESLAGQEAAAAGEDAQRARNSMEEAQRELEAVRRERDELRLRLQKMEQDYAELQAAAEQMAPAARAYESLKEKAASIELEAHSRAESIVREGERQAEAARQEVNAWLERVDSSYARLKSDVAATLSHTITELERTGRALNGVTEELESHGMQLHALINESGNAAGEQPK